MFFWHAIAEERILQAQKEGAFDNLEGAGEPLVLDNDPFVPEDCRMAYAMLKNAGFVPPEVQQQKEIATLTEMLADSTDEKDALRRIRKLNFSITQLNMRRKMPVQFETQQEYYPRLLEKIRLAGR